MSSSEKCHDDDDCNGVLSQASTSVRQAVIEFVANEFGYFSVTPSVLSNRYDPYFPEKKGTLMNIAKEKAA